MDDRRTQSKYQEVVDPEASLWIMIPQLLISIATSSGVVIIVFRLYFGEFAMFAFAFAGFLSILQILMVVGLRFQSRSEFHAERKPHFGLLEKIGGFWLVTCLLGPFISWICGNLAVAIPQARSACLVIAVAFSLVFPVITLLPNVRYVGGKASYVQVPLLVLITMLPVIVGVHYLRKLW